MLRLSSLFHRRGCQLPVGRINSPLDSREKRKNKMRRKSCILHFDVSVPGYDTDSLCPFRSVREKTGNKLVFQEKTKGTLTLRLYGLLQNFFTQFDYYMMYIYNRCKMQNIRKLLLQLSRHLHETITIAHMF